MKPGYQRSVYEWVVEAFGETTANNTIDRSWRFLEEAIELAQVCGCTQDDAHKLVDYVFGRPVGDLIQEVGGVRLTLSALCAAANVDDDNAAETELVRVRRKIDAIRKKDANKPSRSPLPGPTTPDSAKEE